MIGFWAIKEDANINLGRTQIRMHARVDLLLSPKI